MAPPLRALIVDDEAPARRRLARLLDKIAEVELIGDAADAFEALARIAAEPIDVLLLDVHMPEMDGTRLADRLRAVKLPRQPVVIMVTAHPEHAVDAFALDVVDYVLKPVSQARLAEAVERARRRLQVDTVALADDQRDPDLATPASRARLVARHGGSSFLIDPTQVGRLHAAHKYVIATVERREYVFDESLNELERQLETRGFLRVHRAELVNLAHVVALHVDRQGEGGVAEAELRDGTLVPVSRRRLATLRRHLQL